MVRVGFVISLASFASGLAHCEPLSLISSHELVVPYGIEGGAVSPDGRWFAAHAGSVEGLIVVHIATNTTVRRFGASAIAVTGFGRGGPKTGAALRWDAGSRFVWSADVDTTRGGFPVGPLMPARAAVGEPLPLSGFVRHREPPADRMIRLRSPEHSAGLLDGLLWADDRGRAFALFGGKSWMWRLREDAATPAFAMVDVTDGQVIASLPFVDALAPLTTAGDRLDRFHVDFGAASTLPDGRMRLFAVMSARLNGDETNWLRTWLVWTEGERPRLLPQPYGMNSVRYGLTPDGSKVLATLPLGRAMDCGPARDCRPLGPPVEGPLVVAHDILTGAAIWTLRVAPEVPAVNQSAPVVSPDGRVALVELPTRWSFRFWHRQKARNSHHPFDQVGVVDLASGRLLQTLTSNSVPVTFGFFQQGHCAFVQAPFDLQIYEVDAQASASRSRCRPPASLK